MAVSRRTLHQSARSAISEDGKLLVEEKIKNMSPSVKIVYNLKACTIDKDVSKGSRLHADILRKGLLDKNVFVGSTLVNMYSKWGCLGKSQQVFDELSVRNAISWTALVTGYANHKHPLKALSCLEGMKQEGLHPDPVTFTCLLQACGSLGAADKGKGLHDEIVKLGVVGKDCVLDTALVDMYVKCGALEQAQQLFNELSARDVVAWTALITGYCQHGHGEEALNFYELMQRDGLSPNALTYTCTLKACGSIGAAEKGKEIHVDIIREGLLGKDTALGSALVDMYGKCGALLDAQEVFNKLPTRDVVTWTGLIEGYCQHGFGEEALNCFECMKRDGVSPDLITLASILKVCDSIVSAEKGQMYFESISTRYGIIPTPEHCARLMILRHRAGHVDKAISVMKGMIPPSDNVLVQIALLGACRKWGNVKLGRLVFENSPQLK